MTADHDVRIRMYLAFLFNFHFCQPDMKNFGLGLDLPDQEVTGSLSYMNEQNMDTYNMRMKLQIFNRRELGHVKSLHLP